MHEALMREHYRRTVLERIESFRWYIPQEGEGLGPWSLESGLEAAEAIVVAWRNLMSVHG